MRIFIQFLALLIVLLLNSESHAGTVQEMLSSCREIAKSAPSGEMLKLPATFGSGECWGTFSTIQKITKHIDNADKRIYGVCAPRGSTTVQYISIFFEYAERNPQRWHEEFFPIALNSLQVAFPCKN